MVVHPTRLSTSGSASGGLEGMTEVVEARGLDVEEDLLPEFRGHPHSDI
jgi:hypothetical protein